MDVHVIVFDPGLLWLDEPDDAPEPEPEQLTIRDGAVSWTAATDDDSDD